MSRDRLVNRTCEYCAAGFASPAHWCGRFCSRKCVYAWMRAQPRRQTLNQIRRLADDEAIPHGTPRRYRTAHGYIVLRWKVGIRSYVEALEHRIVAGRVAAHVHHVNGSKADNSSENLKPVTSLEHGAEHSRVDFVEAARLYAEGWSLLQLAAKYGVGHVSIMRSLKRRGVAIRSKADAANLRRAS